MLFVLESGVAPFSISSPQGNVFVFTLILSVTFAILWISGMANPGGNQRSKLPRGYLLHGSVTHARYLPVESKHAFTYPALYAFASLRALETNFLNRGYGFWAWAFGYGRSKRRLMAINPCGYLRTEKGGEKGTILERLDEVLQNASPRRPLPGEPPESAAAIYDAWMLTMPSYIGWEGINPLTVYFVYSTVGRGLEECHLSHVVLEVHNTFGEGHVYVLKPGEMEDSEKHRSEGYDHQWTLPRQFHVSPFNDRSGYYTIAVKRPTHPPSPLGSAFDGDIRPPKPTVRVQLYTEQETTESLDASEASHGTAHRGELKLTALLRPTAAHPLTTSTVVWSLAKMPFDLFLTMPRILYQAWILHYGRPRLDVYLRPEMKWTSLWRRRGPVEPSVRRVDDGDLTVGENEVPAREIENAEGGGGVMWLGEGLVERYSRRKVEEFLQRRVDEIGIRVTLIPANPAMDSQYWVSASHNPTSGEDVGENHLKVWYLSSKLFSTLLLAPSAEHALLLGCDAEGWFRASSRRLFNEVFCNSVPDNAVGTPTSNEYSTLQRLRLAPISRVVPATQDDPVPFPVPVPTNHFLDVPSSFNVANCLMISLQAVLDRLEECVFGWMKARIVQGQEPWLMWERATKVYRGDREGADALGWVGSVRSPRQ